MSERKIERRKRGMWDKKNDFWYFVKGFQPV